MRCGTTGAPTPDKSYTFRADPVSVQGLVEAGFDLVSLANNHTLDFGTECMLETIGHVSAAGIVPIGAGKNEASARAPHILEKRNQDRVPRNVHGGAHDSLGSQGQTRAWLWITASGMTTL